MGSNAIARTGVIVATGLLLQACAFTKSVTREWDCKAPEGMSCVTISEADAHATGHSPKAASIVANGTNAPIERRQSLPANEALGRTWTGPARAGDAVMRVWMAAYVDEDGNYHDPSVIYMALPQSRWVDEGEFAPEMEEVGAGDSGRRRCGRPGKC